MLFNVPDNSTNCPFTWGISTPSNNGFSGRRKSAPKRHLNRFSRFCTVHPCDQHTDTQTTLRVTSVTIGCIYARHVMRPNNNSNNNNNNNRLLLLYRCESVPAFSTCSHGRWQCTADSCSQTCSVLGLQHFVTFDGRTYEFHGPPCTYVLVEVCSINRLTPHVLIV